MKIVEIKPYAIFVFLSISILKIVVLNSYLEVSFAYWATLSNPPDISLSLYVMVMLGDVIIALLVWFPHPISWFAVLCFDLVLLAGFTHLVLFSFTIIKSFLILFVLLMIVRLFFLLIPETRRYYRISLPS